MKVTRFVLVNDNGRVYDQYVETIELSYQDDGKTLKVFVTEKQPVNDN